MSADGALDMADIFPNIRTLVLYGVLSPDYWVVGHIAYELSRKKWKKLESVRFPDWTARLPNFLPNVNEHIRLLYPEVASRLDVVWSK